MLNTVTVQWRGVLAMVAISVLAQAGTLRASVNLGNGPADAPANDGMPCQAGLCLPAGTTTPPVDNAPHMPYNLPKPNEILNPVTSEGDALKVISSSTPVALVAPAASNSVSVEDVLNKNLDADPAHPHPQSVNPAKPVTGINPDDAMLSRVKPAKTGNSVLPDDFNSTLDDGPSLVY